MGSHRLGRAAAGEASAGLRQAFWVRRTRQIVERMAKVSRLAAGRNVCTVPPPRQCRCPTAHRAVG
jgi:hypothetical protein